MHPRLSWPRTAHPDGRGNLHLPSRSRYISSPALLLSIESLSGATLPASEKSVRRQEHGKIRTSEGEKVRVQEGKKARTCSCLLAFLPSDLLSLSRQYVSIAGSAAAIAAPVAAAIATPAAAAATATEATTRPPAAGPAAAAAARTIPARPSAAAAETGGSRLGPARLDADLTALDLFSVHLLRWRPSPGPPSPFRRSQTLWIRPWRRRE